MLLPATPVAVPPVTPPGVSAGPEPEVVVGAGLVEVLMTALLAGLLLGLLGLTAGAVEVDACATGEIGRAHV